MPVSATEPGVGTRVPLIVTMSQRSVPVPAYVVAVGVLERVAR